MKGEPSILIVGELINASIKAVRQAVIERDAGFIRDLARRQAAKGVHYLDVCVSTGQGDENIEAKNMAWVVESIQKEVDLPLSIDTTSAVVLREGLEAHRGEAMINSVSAEGERLRPFLEICAGYGGPVVALPVTDKGIPATAEGRLDVCRMIVEKAAEVGVAAERLFFDPLVFPLGVDHKNSLLALETLRGIRQIPGVKSIMGVSNISFGLPRRELFNRTFLVLAAREGLDAVLMNPLDGEMMPSLLAAEALLGRDEMCMRFLKAYRKGLLGRK
ncbi:MAG: dihydropteroate synthase [Bacillota bacterium]